MCPILFAGVGAPRPSQMGVYVELRLGADTIPNIWHICLSTFRRSVSRRYSAALSRASYGVRYYGRADWGYV